MLSNGHCRSCEAPILWAKTVKGKRMPLDPDPVEDGNIWIIRAEPDGPVISVALASEGVPPLVQHRYVAHFVTCPDADAWRKKKR
jgi:hypothetical protein